MSRSRLRVLYLTSVCDPGHTISASAFWWADALASRSESVDVIALDTGGVPRSNMHLHSLHRHGRASRWAVVPRFGMLLAKLMPGADVVFCQYSTKFVFAAWPLATLYRKPIVFWWSHAHVDWRLRLATRMVRAVVTSSADSFRIVTRKKHVIGHGVDIEMFRPKFTPRAGPVRIVSLGRITPVKDVRTIVKAAGILHKRGARPFTLDLVGDVGRSGDAQYLAELRALVRDLGLDDVVRFVGPIPHDLTPGVLHDADIFINAQEAGGVGRAWLESMSSALPTVLCTTAFDDVLTSEQKSLLRFRAADASDLADRLQRLSEMDPASRQSLGLQLREIVRRDHSLTHLVEGLSGVLGEAVDGTTSEINRGAR